MTQATAQQSKQFEALFGDALRECGLQADQTQIEKISDYLQKHDAHVHVGGDETTSDWWKDIANRAVQDFQGNGTDSTKMIRLATTDRESGGFAYVAMSETATRDLINSLEQSLGGRR